MSVLQELQLVRVVPQALDLILTISGFMVLLLRLTGGS
jgi:hypothetical protein